MHTVFLQRLNSTWHAAFWMAGALVSFSTMAVGGRELAAELSTFQILFFRSLIGLPCVLPVVLRIARAGFIPLAGRGGWGADAPADAFPLPTYPTRARGPHTQVIA
jgi:hypothetical protein